LSTGFETTLSLLNGLQYRLIHRPFLTQFLPELLIRDQRLFDQELCERIGIRPALRPSAPEV